MDSLIYPDLKKVLITIEPRCFASEKEVREFITDLGLARDRVWPQPVADLMDQRISNEVASQVAHAFVAQGFQRPTDSEAKELRERCVMAVLRVAGHTDCAEVSAEADKLVQYITLGAQEASETTAKA